MAAASPKLSVILVTWNVADLVVPCLSALVRETAGIPVEIILIDNASSDGTTTVVKSEFPQVTVIANTDNVGFPLANDQALARARGEYVLFLNPDTEVGPGSVAACLEELERDAAIGMSGCRLLLEDGRVQLECARNLYLLRHLLMETLYLHMLFPGSRVFGDHRMSYWDHQGVRDVEAISGAFMLVRTGVARSVGGLPDRVFMYHEDLAFCLRVRRAGWRVRYRGDVTTLHRWRGSSTKSGEALALLEGVYRVELIREAQGNVAAAAARVLFGVRCMVRLLVAGAALPLPLRSIRRRHPRVFDIRSHALQLTWALAPFLVSHRMPGAAPPGERAQPA